MLLLSIETTCDETAVAVTENGRYAFTLTSGEETLVQTVEVKNIDVQAPVAEDLRQFLSYVLYCGGTNPLSPTPPWSPDSQTLPLPVSRVISAQETSS